MDLGEENLVLNVALIKCTESEAERPRWRVESRILVSGNRIARIRVARFGEDLGRILREQQRHPDVDVVFLEGGCVPRDGRSTDPADWEPPLLETGEDTPVFYV